MDAKKPRITAVENRCEIGVFSTVNRMYSRVCSTVNHLCEKNEMPRLRPGVSGGSLDNVCIIYTHETHKHFPARTANRAPSGARR